MKLYIDEENNDVFVDNTANVYAINITTEIKDGGEFSFVYEKDETTFLSELSDLLTWRGRLIKVTDDTNTYVYFTGEIRNCMNITTISITFIGVQSIKMLQNYPAATNPVLLQSNIKALERQRINDYWEHDLSAYTSKIVSVTDSNKLVWLGNPDAVTLRNENDNGSYSANNSGGSTDYLQYDDGNYEYDVAGKNYYYASDDVDSVGPADNEQFYFKFTFKVPMQEDASDLLISTGSLPKARLFLTLKSNFDKHNSTWQDPDMTVLIYNGVTTNKDLVYTDDGSNTSTSTGWSALYGREVAAAPFSVRDEWDVMTTIMGQNALTAEVPQEIDITSTVTAQHFHSVADYRATTDTYLYDFDVFVRVRKSGSVPSDNWSVGAVFFYVGLELTFGSISPIVIGSDVIANGSTDSLLLTEGTPYPMQDNWSVGDPYFITDHLSDILTDMFSNSGADSIFTLSQELVDDKGDTQDHTTTPLLRVLQLYGQTAKKLYWEQNFTIHFKATLSSSGIQLTGADIQDYPDKVAYHRYGDDNFDDLIVSGANEQSYTLALTEPVTVHDKRKVINNPDVVVQHQAYTMTNNLVTYYEKDHVSMSFTVKLSTNSKKENLMIGRTVAIYLESGAWADYRSGGVGELLITKMKYWTDGTNDFANMTVTNRHEV